MPPAHLHATWQLHWEDSELGQVRATTAPEGLCLHFTAAAVGPVGQPGPSTHWLAPLTLLWSRARWEATAPLAQLMGPIRSATLHHGGQWQRHLTLSTPAQSGPWACVLTLPYGHLLTLQADSVQCLDLHEARWSPNLNC